MAKVDPLGLDERKLPIELDPQLYGFSDKDLDRECASATFRMQSSSMFPPEAQSCTRFGAEFEA